MSELEDDLDREAKTNVCKAFRIMPKRNEVIRFSVLMEQAMDEHGPDRNWSKVSERFALDRIWSHFTRLHIAYDARVKDVHDQGLEIEEHLETRRVPHANYITELCIHLANYALILDDVVRRRVE